MADSSLPPNDTLFFKWQKVEVRFHLKWQKMAVYLAMTIRLQAVVA